MKRGRSLQPFFILKRLPYLTSLIQWQELHKRGLSMSDYLKEVKQLTIKFPLIGQQQLVHEINHRILSGLDEQWEPLILSLTPTMSTMATDNLSALLLQQEARRNFRVARDSPLIARSGAGLLGPPSFTNLATAHGIRRGCGFIARRSGGAQGCGRSSSLESSNFVEQTQHLGGGRQSWFG